MSNSGLPIVDRLSPSFDARPDGMPVDILMLHYTGMTSGAAALDRLCDPAHEVSAHYLIEEDGRVYRLVDEAWRAWHAGVSFWRGATSLNGRSIGIELVNPGHEFGYRPFPEVQMLALESLALGILGRHPIPPRNVVAHSDVAPNRKMDPGELLDWRRLAAKGIGLWPTPGAAPADVLGTLAAIGYETVAYAATVAAFQRHYRPADVHGFVDGETARLVGGLADLVGAR